RGLLIRVSGGPTTDRGRRAYAAAMQRGVTSDVVTPRELRAWVGIEQHRTRRAHLQGIAAIDDHTAIGRGLGGPGDVVFHLHDDGWIYTSTAVLHALRAGALDEDALRELVRAALRALAQITDGRDAPQLLDVP